MSLFRICAKFVGPKRYRVSYVVHDDKTLRKFGAACYGPLHGHISFISIRKYRRGCIVNPTKVIKDFIKRRAASS